jgi:hypothetical protein
MKSPIAADELGITYHQLMDLLRYRKMTPPARDTSGHFVWTNADLDRARKALDAMRRPEKVTV